MLPFGAKNLKEFIAIWNNKFPLDKWYREKYKIQFNSEAHKSISLIDVYFEYLEDYIYIHRPHKLKNKKRNAEIKDSLEELKKQQAQYQRGQGNFIKEKVLTSKDIDEMYENLDIDKL